MGSVIKYGVIYNLLVYILSYRSQNNTNVIHVRVNENVEFSQRNVCLSLQCISVHIGSGVVQIFTVYR
jgi:hypothetical protein